jgi:hypothetical protein
VTRLRILDQGRELSLGAGDFPVPVGGPGSPVPVAAAAGPLAWLGLEGGEVFVQPAAGASVACNGTRLAASHWLRDGDVLRSQGPDPCPPAGEVVDLSVTLSSRTPRSRRGAGAA